jgi:hypothetical protein
MTTRVSREPERFRRFHRNSGWETGTDNSLAPGGTPTTEGSKSRAKRWYRLVKNSKRVEMDGGESERPVVCAGQCFDPEGSSPSAARMRGGVSKGGGNASPAGERDHGEP